MIVKDSKGNELVRVINITEDEANRLNIPITHCLAIVIVGNQYLLGWNKWRKDWEIFGGCMEPQETMRQCIIRECFEEIGIKNVPIDYIGVMELNMIPDYFSSEYRKEYGGLYGIRLPEDAINDIEKFRLDRVEIERVALLKDIGLDEKVAEIDKVLLSFYRICNS